MNPATRRWQLLLQSLIAGYSLFGRTFAYLGVWPVFIGEATLAASLVGRRDAYERLLLPRDLSAPLRLVRATLLLFLLYGVFSVSLGFALSMPLAAVIQGAAFNYYALYLVLGLWLGTSDPQLLQRFALPVAWMHGVYGVLYVVFLNDISVNPAVIGERPTGVPLFGQPTAAALMILLLLCFESNLKRSLLPILLNAFVLLGVQVRAEWLGFGLAIGCFAVLAGQVRRFAVIAAVLIGLLAVSALLDLRLPGLEGRGGEVSARGVVGRALATLSPDLASGMIDDAASFKGTVEWRQEFWNAIWRDINRTTDRKFFLGNGYGFPITELVTHVEEGVRTPHNVALYALVYGGWIGLILFAAFQVSLLLALWVTYRRGHGPFGLCLWLLGLSVASFGNLLETPYGAIPFYLLCGVSLAPLSSEPDNGRHPPSSEDTPAPSMPTAPSSSDRP